MTRRLHNVNAAAFFEPLLASGFGQWLSRERLLRRKPHLTLHVGVAYEKALIFTANN